MYELRTHVVVVGLMTGMLADYFGHNTIAGVSVLVTYAWILFS